MSKPKDSTNDDISLELTNPFVLKVLRRFVKRIRGRLEGRVAMNQRTLLGHMKQGPNSALMDEIYARINGYENAIADLDYIAREFGLFDAEGGVRRRS